MKRGTFGLVGEQLLRRLRLSPNKSVCRSALPSLMLLGICTADALAQGPGSVVQLPTFSSFSVDTTVSVPDRGSAYLGGVGRAASARGEFGVPALPFMPFRNRAIGTQRSASGAYVTATIHDFEAIDEYLLSQPTPFSRRLVSGQSRSPAGLARAVPPRDLAGGSRSVPSPPATSLSPPTKSVAEARADRLRQQQMRAAEAAEFFQRGQDAESAGKMGAARVCYQMVARRASGDLKARVLAKLEAVGRGPAVSQLTQHEP